MPFAFTGPGIPRAGNTVRTEAGEGIVTSGSFSPCLEKGIGMAYVPMGASEPGTSIEIDVRGTPRAAEVAEKLGIKASVVYVYASRVLQEVRCRCAEIEEELGDGSDPGLS